MTANDCRRLIYTAVRWEPSSAKNLNKEKNEQRHKYRRKR